MGFLEDVELLKGKRIIKKDLDISERTGYQKSTISNYLSGKVPASKNFIEKFYEVYKNELAANKVLEQDPEYKRQGNIIYVPLFATGGFMRGYANKVYLDSLERFSLPGVTGEHYAFEVAGDSMEPFALPGEIAIARAEEQLEWMVKGRAYILQTIDGILLKFFENIKKEKPEAVFKSMNKNYKEITIPLKEIKRIYQVVRILKDPYKINHQS